MKKAFITGITGQDGSYLAEFLLKKNYQVHGIMRKSSSFNTERLNSIYQDINVKNKKLFLYYGDVIDQFSMQKIISKVKPNEIYNLAAQSHVKVSFEEPYYTCYTNALGTLNILEIIKNLNLRKTKFYQASTSEMFGNNNKKLSEKTNFDPVSPYAASKLFAHNLVKIYRDSYKIFACNGILFNHESPRRGNTFVTKKIIIGLIRIIQKKQKCLYLGNLNAKRDWGHAKDYVEAQWKMLQMKKPDDYIIATGKKYSIRTFIKKVAKKLNLKIKFIGKGMKERVIDEKKNIIIKIDKNYFRPQEVPSLIGDSSKAEKKLNWKSRYNIDELIDDIIKSTLENEKN